MADALQLLLPPGRIIMGDVYKGSDKDSKGQPRLVKSGANKGQQITQYFIGVAIPKAGEQAWWQTAWGQQIMAVGQQGFPNFFQNPAFAWKIEDGDSTIPNKSNRRMCDNEGAPGHWVLKFSSQFAPPVYQQPSPGVFERVDAPGLIKTGWWVQVNASVKSNGSSESPGIYLNQQMVLFVKQDKEISSGPDAATAFAGAAVASLPGVAAMPFAGAAPQAGMPHPGMAAMPGTPAAAMPMQPAMAAAAAPTMVQPHPGFLAGPGAMSGGPVLPGAPAAGPAMPMAPGLPPSPAAAPPVPAGPQMTPAGIQSGFTLDQYRQKGWTDDQLRAGGIIY